MYAREADKVNCRGLITSLKSQINIVASALGVGGKFRQGRRLNYVNNTEP